MCFKLTRQQNEILAEELPVDVRGFIDNREDLHNTVRRLIDIELERRNARVGGRNHRKNTKHKDDCRHISKSKITCQGLRKWLLGIFICDYL